MGISSRHTPQFYIENLTSMFIFAFREFATTFQFYPDIDKFRLHNFNFHLKVFGPAVPESRLITTPQRFMVLFRFQDVISSSQTAQRVHAPPNGRIQ